MATSPTPYFKCVIWSGFFEIVKDSFCSQAFILLLNLLIVRNLIMTHLSEGKGPTWPWFSCPGAQLWL